MGQHQHILSGAELQSSSSLFYFFSATNFFCWFIHKLNCLGVSMLLSQIVPDNSFSGIMFDYGL